jgi:hypothetical protein
MKTVNRHQISSTEFIQLDLDKLEARFPKKLARFQEAPQAILGHSVADFQQGFHLSLCAEHPKEVTLRFLRFFHAVALSNFKFGAGKEPFSMDFDGTVIHFTPQRKSDFMSVDHWKLAYDACMLLRDMDGLRFLATIPEEVFEKSNNRASAFDLAYYRFMAHFFNGGKNTGALLIDAMEEGSKPQSNPTRTKFVDLVRYPELQLMEDFVRGDSAAFNNDLYDALVSHKKYYGTSENGFATPGWIALPLLSACTLASDGKKFPIEVESEYLPKWLIMGEGIK